MTKFTFPTEEEKQTIFLSQILNRLNNLFLLQIKLYMACLLIDWIGNRVI